MGKTKAVSDEAKQKELEKKEREKREKKEHEEREKEKLKKKKLRQKRKKAKENKEKKRIKKAINFPFKTLFQASSFFSLILFIVMYWGNSFDIQSSVFNAFMLFISLYFGVGVVMVSIFFVISQHKEIEMEERKRQEEEERQREIEREKEEMEKMDREIKEAERLREQELNNFRSARKNSRALPEQNKDLDLDDDSMINDLNEQDEMAYEEPDASISEPEKMMEEEFMRSQMNEFQEENISK
jgi:Flp pilus assembly protein TadB